MNSIAAKDVELVVLNPEGEFLMLHGDGLNSPRLVSGTFDDGTETPEQAVNRVHRTAVAVGIRGLRLAGELIDDDGVAEHYVFWTRVRDPSGVRPTQDSTALHWLTEATVPEGESRLHVMRTVALARAALLRDMGQMAEALLAS